MDNGSVSQADPHHDLSIRAACEADDYGRAATLLIESFGDQVMGYLVNRLGDEADASEVFSMFAEDVWRGLPGFEWRCSARTWTFTLARYAANRYTKQPQQQAQRHVALDDLEGVRELVAEVRDRTLVYLRTVTKTAVQRLREQLDEEDQTLLMLRVDQDLSFRELARVMAGPTASLSEDDLDREAARLRKRFQAAKDRLRKLAEAEGLLE